jgi:hypothetical protein
MSSAFLGLGGLFTAHITGIWSFWLPASSMAVPPGGRMRKKLFDV